MASSDLFQCELCAKSYRHEKKLKRHVKSVHSGSLEFQCLSCGRIFSSDSKLLQHSKGGKCAKKRQKKKKINIYACHDCNATFTKLTALRKHFKSEHNKKEIKDKPASTSVFYESDDDAIKCLHERVTPESRQPQKQQQPEAAAVEATWR